MKVLATLVVAASLVGCTSTFAIERSNMITYGRLVRMIPLPGATDVYGRTRWSTQYNILLANGETLQVVTTPDSKVLVTDCLEIGYVGMQVTSLAVIDPNVGCHNIPIPNHRAQPLFR